VINIKIAEIMGKHRLTKKAIADATGIRPNTVSLLWQGTTKRLEIEHLDKLCEILKCQPGDLLEHIPDEQREGNNA
jgi:putative transcriptional regulator